MDLMTTIAVQLPMCLVLGAGCVIAVVTWSMHPKVSALACIGSGGLLLLTVAFDFCMDVADPDFGSNRV